MSKKGNTGAVNLDLGLTEILNRAQAVSADPQAQGASSPQPTAIYTLTESDGEFASEFASLAQSKQWGILVSKAEAAITDERDLEARLWWIRGHLGALSLPVSLLAAPFESVCRHLAADPARLELHRALVGEIAVIVQDRLRGVGDRRQEHAVVEAVSRLGIADPSKLAKPAWGRIPPITPRFELGTAQQSSPQAEQRTSNSIASSRVEVPNPSRRMPRTLIALAVFLLASGLAVFGFRAKSNAGSVESASEALSHRLEFLEMKRSHYSPRFWRATQRSVI